MKELPDVVLSITEPYAATEMTNNIDKYFTEDAFLLYPLLNQPHTKHGRANLKGIYKTFRMFTINNKIMFHAVMFSEDRLNATIDLTESLQVRWLPIVSLKLRFISRVDLRKESDGKYRICRQEDNYPNDLKRAGIRIVPGLATITSILKLLAGLLLSTAGMFFLEKGWFGP